MLVNQQDFPFVNANRVRIGAENYYCTETKRQRKTKIYQSSHSTEEEHGMALRFRPPVIGPFCSIDTPVPDRLFKGQYDSLRDPVYAMLMSTHSRLGAESPLNGVPIDIFAVIIKHLKFSLVTKKMVMDETRNLNKLKITLTSSTSPPKTTTTHSDTSFTIDNNTIRDEEEVASVRELLQDLHLSLIHI